MSALRALLGFLASSSLASPAPPDSPPRPIPAVREVNYAARLDGDTARFAVTVAVEPRDRAEASIPLFEGDVVVLPAELPSGFRLVREGQRYRLLTSRRGRQQLQFQLVARVQRTELWSLATFTGPAAGIARLTATSDQHDAEIELLSGTPLANAAKGTPEVRAILGPDARVALRWRSKAAEATRAALVTCVTAGSARLTPTVVQYQTELQYEILQGAVTVFEIALPKHQTLTQVTGGQIRDWQTSDRGDQQVLRVELVKPAEKNYRLTLATEQTVDAAPFQGGLALPAPLALERESGQITLFAEDVVLEIVKTGGLRQVNAPAGAITAYQFHGRPLDLEVRLRPLEPVIQAADRITVRLEDARLLVTHSLALDVQKAGAYRLELGRLAGLTVTEVRGDGLEDWTLEDDRLHVRFATRLLGQRQLEVQLERPYPTFPAQFSVSPLWVVNATRQTTQIGVGAAPGIQLKTAALTGLREVPVDTLTPRGDGTLAYRSEQADWTLELAAERLSPRVIADVFNLVTIGDGLVGGSATVRYAMVNQGLQEFRLRVPARWKNVDFTGPQMRRKERVEPAPDAVGDTNTVLWRIILQDKAWSGYTLVVTYDEPFDPQQADLAIGGLRVLDAERESGSIALTSAATLQLRELKAGPPLRRIDESELAASDRALSSRSVLLAYRYAEATTPYVLTVEVRRFEDLPVLAAVADRTQLITVLTEDGQMLTQATFMVKNNDKQFQSIELPAGARLWSSFVNRAPAKAEQHGNTVLVPLPQGTDRDQTFAVEVVYACEFAPLRQRWGRPLALAAPRTDVQTTFAEWELYLPATHELKRFGGNMTVARGTTYRWQDGWRECVEFYRGWRRPSLGILVPAGLVLVVVALVVVIVRYGARGAGTVLAGAAILLVLAGMLLPSLAKAKAKSQKIVALNNLKQIGLALRLYADDHMGKLPDSLTRLTRYVGTDRCLIDPDTGQPFLYLGRGTAESLTNTVIVYSPSSDGGRAVLLGDGSVTRVTETQFASLLQPGEAGQAQPPPFGNTLAATVPPTSSGSQARPPDPMLAPLAEGLRPLRIELPRTGRRLVFTKVLNVQEEPLTVAAWVVRTRVWNAARSTLQATAFLLGLALAWWQVRRAIPQSLLMALAATLVLGSVGSLLITTRLLGLALAVGLPTLLAGALGITARWVWRRTHRAGECAAPGASDTLSAGGNGVSPALPLIALLLVIPGSLSGGTITPAQPDSKHPAEVSLLSAHYTGEIHDRVAEFDVELRLAAFETDRVVPLFGAEVAVASFSTSRASAKLVRDGTSMGVFIPGKGEVTVRVRGLVKLEEDGTSRRLCFGVPAALASRVSLVVKEADAVVEFPSAVTFQAVSQGSHTRVEGILGASDRVDLSWAPKTKRAADVATTAFCQQTARVTLAGGVRSVRSVFEYQVTQGELRELRVRLPRTDRLRRVEGDLIRTWNLVAADTASSTNDAQVLKIELVKGQSARYRLVLETERPLEALPSTIPIELPHALDVQREAGWLGLDSGDELGVTIATVTGLHQVDAADFARRAGVTNAVTIAYEFPKPGFRLAARVEPLRPEIEAMVVNRFRIGAEQHSLSSRVDYTIKRAGVFTLRLGLPSGFQVEEVALRPLGASAKPDAARVALPWTDRVEAETRVLDVTLPERTLGPLSLELQLRRALTKLTETVIVAGVQPLDVAKTSGFVVVSAETGIQLQPTAVAGLTEVPAPTVPEGGGGLAYKFLATGPGLAPPGWQLEMAAEPMEAWIRAEVVHWLTLSDNLVTGRAQIRYEIQNAPVKELRVRVPAVWRNVEVLGANIRRRDQDGESWRVELQHKVVGHYLLTVTWDQPFGIAAPGQQRTLELTGVETRDTEREVGFIALGTRTQLEVTPQATSSELLRVDSRELPDWAGRPETPTLLAFRYLRPGYHLSLVTRRFDPATVLQALVEEASLTTVVAEDGQMMTALAFAVRNNGRQFLELAVPPGAEVWSAFVAGQAVRPSQREGKVLIPLERSLDDAPITVEVTYVGATAFPRGHGRVQLASPSLDLPVKNARWALYVPAGYAYRQFGGTMARELGAAPIEGAFTLAEYSRAESTKRRDQQREIASSIAEARHRLAGGKLEDANQVYRRANRYGLPAEDAVVRQLEQELRKAQALNFKNAQRELLANNLEFLQTQIGQPGPQPVVADYDDQTAEQQWARVQQAQEVAAANARPLRVNLPTRGLRYTFSQALQTQPHKPFVVEFVAVNTQATTGWQRWVSGALAFAVLWGLSELWRRSYR